MFQTTVNGAAKRDHSFEHHRIRFIASTNPVVAVVCCLLLSVLVVVFVVVVVGWWFVCALVRLFNGSCVVGTVSCWPCASSSLSFGVFVGVCVCVCCQK